MDLSSRLWQLGQREQGSFRKPSPSLRPQARTVSCLLGSSGLSEATTQHGRGGAATSGGEGVGCQAFPRGHHLPCGLLGSLWLILCQELAAPCFLHPGRKPLQGEGGGPNLEGEIHKQPLPGMCTPPDPSLLPQADMDTIMTSGTSEAVPRVLSGDAQNLCMSPMEAWGVRFMGPTDGVLWTALAHGCQGGLTACPVPWLELSTTGTLSIERLVPAVPRPGLLSHIAAGQPAGTCAVGVGPPEPSMAHCAFS